jgi:hypothetical protein
MESRDSLWKANHMTTTLRFRLQEKIGSIARNLAELLSNKGLAVFYDEYETANLWGKDLYQHLHGVYAKRAKFCVLLVSSAYAQKMWTKHELKQAQARAFQQNQEYILPLRLDDTELTGLPHTISYVDARTTPLDWVAELVIKKLDAQPASRPSSIHNTDQEYEPVGEESYLDKSSTDDTSPIVQFDQNSIVGQAQTVSNTNSHNLKLILIAVLISLAFGASATCYVPR